MSGPPEFRSITMKRIFRLWRMEIFNLLVALAMLGSIYGILQYCDGQRISDWSIPINLSTVIALLTVIFRTSLVLIFTEIIGQATWHYFIGNGRQEPPIRRLIETSRFSDASQGIFGAVKLIPMIIRHPDILLAITGIIVSLGTGSFVQQAIQTQSCKFSTDSIDAFIPISRNITLVPSGGNRTSAKVAAALSSALAPDNEGIGSPLSFGCSTRNCTFSNPVGGLYNTIGMCSSCTDTSALITSANRTVDYGNGTYSYKWYELPNGLSISTESDTDPKDPTLGPRLWQMSDLSVSSLWLTKSEYPESMSDSTWTGDLDWAGDLVSPEMRAFSQWAFANVTVLTPNWHWAETGYTGFLAATCTLYPCLRTYNASVIMGNLDEVLTSTVPMAPNVNAAFSNKTLVTEIFLQMPDWYAGLPTSTIPERYDTYLEAVQSPCLVNNTVWTEENRSTTIITENLLLLQADPGANRSRHVKFENITAPIDCIYGLYANLWGHLSDFMTSSTFNGTCTSLSRGDIDCGISYWLSSFYDDNGITTSDIFDKFQRFADRLTNKIRMGLLGDPEYIFGQTIETTICVHIDYKWLAFPTVLAFITSILLVWTIFWNWQRQGCQIVWKTSILPFLFYSERFVVQNGEDVSVDSSTASRGVTKEALMDMDQMQNEAKQQAVRFTIFD